MGIHWFGKETSASDENGLEFIFYTEFNGTATSWFKKKNLKKNLEYIHCRVSRNMTSEFERLRKEKIVFVSVFVFCFGR